MHIDRSTVDARPVKSFFVQMLTRDIALVDAILDLLDNCVDGILRQRGHGSGHAPYGESWAEIAFDKNSFTISDNCGGIPSKFHNYAFRMGKEDENRDNDLRTVGVYGIGMKRAIFKIGKRCSISTQSDEDCYTVKITPEWINDREDWTLPLEVFSQRKEEDGTTIKIEELNEGIATQFDEDREEFTRELTEKIKTHYAFILNKGFCVKINGHKVEAKPTRLIFVKTENDSGTDRAIRPYVYQTEHDGVEVFVSVGFTKRIPSQEDINDEQEKRRYSSMDAGWTIICNDRVVLYCDRTELTGWGEAGVPRYHTQFIAISGIVEFQSNDAAKLPTTTTKRGIDANSRLYLQVKNRMREGMQVFTNYTNKWKGNAHESEQHMDLGTPYTLDQIKSESQILKFYRVHAGLQGEQFKPKLPEPKPVPSSKEQISYSKDIDDIQAVRAYLFGDKIVTPSRVGEKCFDMMMEEAQQ